MIFIIIWCKTAVGTGAFPKQRKLKDPDVLGQDVRHTNMMYAHVMYTTGRYDVYQQKGQRDVRAIPHHWWLSPSLHGWCVSPSCTSNVTFTTNITIVMVIEYIISIFARCNVWWEWWGNHFKANMSKHRKVSAISMCFMWWVMSFKSTTWFTNSMVAFGRLLSSWRGRWRERLPTYDTMGILDSIPYTVFEGQHAILLIVIVILVITIVAIID